MNDRNIVEDFIFADYAKHRRLEEYFRQNKGKVDYVLHAPMSQCL